MTSRVSLPEPGGQARASESEPRLPRVPGVVRRWVAEHPKLVDGGIVVCYLLGCLLMGAIDGFSSFPADVIGESDSGASSLTDGHGRYLTWPWLLLTLCVTASTAALLWFRRRWPLLGVILVSIFGIFELGMQALPSSVALVFLLYAVPVYQSVAKAWIAYGAAVLVSSGYLFLSTTPAMGVIGPGAIASADSEPLSTSDFLAVSITMAIWLLAVLLFGINMGNRRRYVQALIDRAHQLAREREQRAVLAAVSERARIAREMHDIVAHSLSVVVTLSEGASLAVDTRPQDAKRAMERAADTGRTALIEMRRLLGVLHEPGSDAGDGGPYDTVTQAPLAPQPGAAELEALVAGFGDAGLEIEFTQRGESSPEPAQQLAVYRIVQEALTNALRYAGAGSSVTARVTHKPQRSIVEVIDKGSVGLRGSASRSGDARLAGAGMGLAGARQRAAIFGGVLEAGPYGKGWRVIAEIPFDARTRHGTGESEQ